MKRRLATAAKFALSAFLLVLLYRRVDREALSAALASVRLPWLAAFFALLGLNTLLNSLKWRVVLASDGIRLPLRTLFASHLIGSFFNLFLPSTIGGDGYRIWDIGRRSGRTVHAAASVMADRLTGFLALAVYGLVFPFFVRRLLPDWRLMLLPAAAFCGLAGLTFCLWEQRLLRRMAGRLPGRLGQRITGVLDGLLASLRVYGSDRRTVTAMLLLSFAFQFTAIVAVFCLGRALSLGVPLLPFCFFVPFITLMEMLPITIFGIGLRDTGYVWFMAAVGRSAEDAAALSVLYVAATLLYVASGGILFALRKREERPHAQAR